MEAGYEGRPVVIFGAAGALGHGLAAAFAEAGAAVTGVDKGEPGTGRTLPGVRYRTADAQDDGSVRALFEEIPVPWAVVNTVGGYAPARPLGELDVAELNDQIQLNLVTAAVITKHALPAMRRSGQGRIVHTASRAAVVTEGSGFAYSMSKLGVLHLVSMAASEVRGTGVTVNCVVPSVIDTPANRAAMPSADHAAWPKVADIARSYLFLASPAAGLVNGARVPV